MKKPALGRKQKYKADQQSKLQRDICFVRTTGSSANKIFIRNHIKKTNIRHFPDSTVMYRTGSLYF